MSDKFYFFDDKGAYNYLEMKYNPLQVSESELENKIVNSLPSINITDLEFTTTEGSHVVLIYSEDLNVININEVMAILEGV